MTGPRPTAPGSAASAQPGRAPVLVMGVGNELFTDEGLGCEAARRIAALGIEGVDVVDGATLGLGLLPEIADRQSLLLLDAIVSDGAGPGDLVELHDEQVPARYRLAMSVHQIGVEEALAAAEFAGFVPPRLAAVGLVPTDLTLGYGLSPAIEERMDTLVERALAVLASWGLAVPA